MAEKNISTLLAENTYIYISHLDEGLKYWIIPSMPDDVSDSLGSSFSQSSALGRTAPVFTYSQSGPRTVSINFKFHRDMMNYVNSEYYSKSYKKSKGTEWNKFSESDKADDYFDDLIHALQAISLPKYNINNKSIEPPLIAIRLTNEIFIKGIVNGNINVTYSKPILDNGKYAVVSLGLTITEVDPYDATSIYKNGSFRGLTKTLKAGFKDNLAWEEV